jgi:hypothetical protein
MPIHFGTPMDENPPDAGPIVIFMATYELKRLFKKLEISMPNSVLAIHPLPPEL